MSGNVSLIDRHIDQIEEKADCSKCITECRYKEWFEHEMQVQKSGCSRFKSRGKQQC